MPFKMGISRFSLAASALGMLLASPPSAASDAPFDFRVDRFELLMAPPSSRARFLPDFIDEFDDPMLRDWFKEYGTSSAGDGALHLTNPGTKLPNAFGVLPGTTLDLSLVGSQRQVADGEGDFVARSYWEPDDLAPGDFNHMSLATNGRNGLMEVAGLALTNMTPDGETTRYTIVQHLVRFTAGAVQERQFASVTVEPSAISAQVLFELAFDDAANTLTTRYSLDGGVTFHVDFVPVRIFDGLVYGYGWFLLGADPQTGTVRASLPAPPLCRGGSAYDAGRIVKGRRPGSVSITGMMREGPRPRQYDPRRDGVQLRITDRTLPETPVVDLTGASALRGGVPGCGARDGWRRIPAGFVYRNETNALPPACTPGSAAGVTRVRLRKKARRGFQFAVDLATPWRPAPGARVATTIVIGEEAEPAAQKCSTVEVRCAVSGDSVDCETQGPGR